LHWLRHVSTNTFAPFNISDISPFKSSSRGLLLKLSMNSIHHAGKIIQNMQ